jgi:hypothetical protein
LSRAALVIHFNQQAIIDEINETLLTFNLDYEIEPSIAPIKGLLSMNKHASDLERDVLEKHITSKPPSSI